VVTHQLKPRSASLLAFLPLASRFVSQAGRSTHQATFLIERSHHLTEFDSEGDPEVLNPNIKLHILPDKGIREEIIAPVNQGAAPTEF
jgi:hypothetical protein